MQYQWYPGHMTKAKRQMQEDIKLIDLIIELVDARIPVSSHNPDIDQLGQNKSRIVLLNKADLADEQRNQEWCSYYKERGMYAFAGKACAKTGNKPGVTKGKQWIRLNKNVELLDTPGILWPKFEDQTVGLHLAYIGSIKDELVNVEEMALELIGELTVKYPDILSERYTADETAGNIGILEQLARSRGCLKKGSELDYAKAAALLMEDFRSGRLGRISIETP